MINISMPVFIAIVLMAVVGIACVLHFVLGIAENKKNRNVLLDMDLVNNKEYLLVLALTNDEHRTWRKPTFNRM